MASNSDIKIITEIKLKCLFAKINGYCTNHMFQVLGETPLQELFGLGKDLKMPIWEYNGKYYLKFHAVKFEEVKVESCFKKIIFILWIYRLVNTTFRKMESRLQVIVFLK